jgi:hypothetical protein
MVLIQGHTFKNLLRGREATEHVHVCLLLLFESHSENATTSVV